MNSREIVAFIPVRGGSKSIPLKNIKPFLGRPLVYWVAKAANDCKYIKKVYIATDDIRIKDVVEQLGLQKVVAVDRSKESATDSASTESAMIEFSEKVIFDDIVLIQATSPLLTAVDLDEAILSYIEKEADSLVSVVRQKRFIWEQGSKYAKPVNYDPQNRPLRQQWEGYFVENGAFYITSRCRLLTTNCRISGNIALYEMSEETYFELDSPTDWVIAEHLKRYYVNEQITDRVDFDQINLLICDVDGVLTDAGMYYSDRGEELKKFNARDGKGIELLRKQGVKVMFLTSEAIDIVKKRADKLNIDFLYMGIHNKKAFLEKFFIDNPEHSFQRTAYIGDDINDLECIQSSLFSATPNDGAEYNKHASKYVCALKGGQGCVREVCDLIISRRKHV